MLKKSSKPAKPLADFHNILLSIMFFERVAGTRLTEAPGYFEPDTQHAVRCCMGRALWWLQIISVAMALSSCARGTPAHTATEPQLAEPADLGEGDPLFAMCVMLISPHGHAGAEQSFAAATAMEAEPQQAAQHYFAGAGTIAQSPHAHDPTLIYNRRVAYANGINLLLGKHDLGAARTALEHAASIDSDLADELRGAAAALPNPMHCTPPSAEAN